LGKTEQKERLRQIERRSGRASEKEREREMERAKKRHRQRECDWNRPAR